MDTWEKKEDGGRNRVRYRHVMFRQIQMQRVVEFSFIQRKNKSKISSWKLESWKQEKVLDSTQTQIYYLFILHSYCTYKTDTHLFIDYHNSMITKTHTHTTQTQTMDVRKAAHRHIPHSDRCRHLFQFEQNASAVHAHGGNVMFTSVKDNRHWNEIITKEHDNENRREEMCLKGL